MKLTPILIVYLILGFLLGITVKELNQCTQKLRKYQIRIQPVE